MRPVFRGLRIRLTLLYALAAMVLVALVGAGAYFIVVRYFWRVTDLALQHKMVHELRSLNAPIPVVLQSADRDWSLVRGELDFLPPPANLKGSTETQKDDDHEDDHDDHDDKRQPTPLPTAVLTTPDSAELASIYVLPLDSAGHVLLNVNIDSSSIQADLPALQAALVDGSDVRPVRNSSGQTLRILTFRVDARHGPAALQLGRELSDQQGVLSQLMLGLLSLGTLSMVLLGGASWWLAGRALRPSQQAWERQQRFIASASHELRAPLTLMRASAEVALRERSADDADQQLLLRDILDESDHMRRLVDDLLMLSRLDSGNLPLNITAVELGPLLSQIQRQVARLGDERSIQVECDGVDGQVQADPERLRQVLLILLDNALRYTPTGGHIHMSARALGHMWQLEVRDTGSGIAPEDLPHIFERFYRADMARGREGGNAGLGLSIAQALISHMGGQISAQSTSGKGTSILLSLPAAVRQKR